MTSSNNSVEFPIASTRLRSLILKKHISTLYTQITQEEKADPQLTKLILFKMFQIFQINKINFQQYPILHNHPDTFIHKCDAITQTDYTTIRPKPFLKNLSNRRRTSLEKEKLVSYWQSDDNDSTDDELQKDPPEAILNDNSPYKTYTYIAFVPELSFTRRSQVTQHTDAAHHQLSSELLKSVGVFSFRSFKNDIRSIDF